MKDKSIRPTSVEKVMRENDFIVSKTDKSGRITYGNRIFIEFSGYNEEELLGTQHNVVRHPDMPRAVFKLLWDTIARGDEIFAFVKNLAKDGSFYWVFANVTPTYDREGRIDGYFSVRRKPNPKALQVVTDLYRQMLAAERAAGSREAIDASTRILLGLLAEKETRYNDLILGLQGMP
ncbi:PAS domain-containing protein [Endothiovibrio diazotrophicus]